MGIFSRRAKCIFGRVFVEQITLKKYNRSILHSRLRNIGCIKQRCCTEKSVHRAIAIGRDNDQTPTSIFGRASRTRKKLHTHHFEVARECIAQSISRNFADETRLATKTCQPVCRVRRRTTAHLGARVNE